MGGLSGDINHLHEDPNLTFGELKDIFIKASGGDLLGTEKTDGINLYLSYSVKDGEAKAARNKGNVRSGGLNAEQLAAKFTDRGQLTNTFNDAFSSWNEIIKNLNPQTQIKIFGSDAEIYYNVEILDPKSSNVINYDNRSLIIHQTGHSFFDRNTGNISDVDVSENYKLLSSTLNKIEHLNQNNFKIINNALKNIKGLDDKTTLQLFLSKIENIQSNLKLEDNQTIADYVFLRLKNYFKKNLPDITPSIIQLLSNKILGINGLNINKILEKVPPESKEKIKLISNNSSTILKELISPLETIIYEYSIELLKGFESIFVLDSKKEIQRLKDEVALAIKTIESSKNEHAIEILNNQLKKLKSIDNIYSASEGFVFQYNGKIYKFTGNFSPINQILGLFKFGRGKNIPPMKDIVKESDKNRIIALLPGGYKPPHIGHYLGAKYFANINNVDEVKVIISPKERFCGRNIVKINGNKSLKVWNIFVKNDPKIKPIISRVASPVRDVYDYIKQMNPGDTLLLGKGEKETEQDTRFDRAQEWANKNNPGVNVKILQTKVDEKLKNIGACNLREFLSFNKKEEFFKFMPTHLSLEEKEQIWNILIDNDINHGENIMNENNEIEEVKYKPEFVLNKAYQLVLQQNPNLTRQQFDDIRIPHNMFGYVNPAFYAIQKVETPEEIARIALKFISAPKEYVEKSSDKYCLRLKKQNKNVNEMSSGGGGAVQGFASPVLKPKKSGFNENIFFNRQNLIEEILLRDKIRSLIKETHDYKNKEMILLKNLIRECIIKEAKSNVADTVHASTGINVLEDLLKKIVPSLEQDYKTLTSNEKQRESFRAHILNAISKTLTAADVNQNAGGENGNLVRENNIPLVHNLDSTPMKEVDVTIGNSEVNPGDEKKFIDINKKPKDSEEEDTFTIAGKDVTGRNMAQMTYDKIEKNIVDSYSVLSDPEDKKLFYDYLLANIKLYFSKFESEIETNIKEPEAGNDIVNNSGSSTEPSNGEELKL